MSADALPPLDLADFLRARALDAEIVAPGVPMPTVDAAAAVLGVEPERIFKSILFSARDGRCVMAVACGKARVDVERLAALTGLAGLRLASPEVALQVTGYPAGGTPPVGHRERFAVVVDARVAAQEWGWAGGGRKELMVRIRSADIVRLTGARVAEIVRDVVS
ncbi:MAG: YbaK/EbsC family protein [Candidatus Eisenbacteria bacterium]|uniref:YbaK/EbsC family protein n=1 Tax=Eiseniibacteriota bacterium TaxID=2212470 RepID=A0A538UCR8_UNCEI|nr:MAG: YbaK/EbsC family protein [Candidatus Eisenbacteria bacterium]